MNKPDYSKYTLEELYQAQSTIDSKNYPDRAKEIQKAIDTLKIKEKDSKDLADSKTVAESEERKFMFVKAVHQMRNAAIFLLIASLVFSIGIFLRYTFQVDWSNLYFSFRFQFPGSSEINKEHLLLLVTIFIYTINLTFFVGSVGSFFKISIFRYLLAISWGLMCIGIHLWRFMWWPTVSFDFPLEFNLTIFGLAIGFRINLLSAFFFTWTLTLIPEMIKEMIPD